MRRSHPRVCCPGIKNGLYKDRIADLEEALRAAKEKAAKRRPTLAKQPSLLDVPLDDPPTSDETRALADRCDAAERKLRALVGTDRHKALQKLENDLEEREEMIAALRMALDLAARASSTEGAPELQRNGLRRGESGDGRRDGAPASTSERAERAERASTEPPRPPEVTVDGRGGFSPTAQRPNGVVHDPAPAPRASVDDAARRPSTPFGLMSSSSDVTDFDVNSDSEASSEKTHDDHSHTTRSTLKIDVVHHLLKPLPATGDGVHHRVIQLDPDTFIV